MEVPHVTIIHRLFFTFHLVMFFRFPASSLSRPPEESASSHLTVIVFILGYRCRSDLGFFKSRFP